MERSIDRLPVSDYTVLANSHYYFLINDWLDYLDKLITRTRYCIIVTAKKKPKLCKASADLADIRNYFKNWDEAGIIDNISLENDPFPRKLWGLCFKNRVIDRVPIDSLDNADGTNYQAGFWEELDKGIKPLDTRYYNQLKTHRKRNWPSNRLIKYMVQKAEMFEDVKKNGLQRPVIINSDNRLIDGIHRYEIMKYLGYKSILVRRTRIYGFNRRNKTKRKAGSDTRLFKR